MTSDAQKFTMGQTVFLVKPYTRREPREASVVKVGRTLVYIEQYGREWAFHIDSGMERRGPNPAGLGSRIFTLAEWEERKRRADVTDALRDHGIGPVGYASFSQDVDTLERILAILTRPTEGTDQ